MKKILIHTASANQKSLFDPNERDAYNDPAIYLRERLLSLGYNLEAADKHSLKDCAWILFYDSTSVNPYSGLRGMAKKLRNYLTGKPLLRNLYAECVRAGIKDKMALFLWEPPAVLQSNWNPHLHSLFPVIFTWNDAFIDGRKFFKIHWPQTRKFPEVPEVSFGQKKLLVNISTNRYSRHPRELYSARRATIRHFERNRPRDFDLYGVGWNQPASLVQRMFSFTRQKYPSYRGTIRHKWDVLPLYRFSVCYENMFNEPGWITEKIFDSMRAGCVPIYWGAPNITDYVDEPAFVDRKQFKSDAELENYITNITENDYNQYQEAMKAYLNSERFKLFLPSSFSETIINVLKLK